ncbi:dTDP-glucose 4,6-dehydratase [uncultured Fructobacillus sp.]|uniref:dTDP-glucose 4,6-dehydratase n=1 Tax=uncultured Fructobacillus sp. TaxID=591942 RepID=UPI0025942AE0|nr:dTDP-glucose 4,6-dehydratase [uncultured Fructobacillus sp.]
MRYQKILVTGGAGFIGANFVRYLLEHDQKVEITVLDKLTYSGNLDNITDLSTKRLHVVVGDICDAPLVDQLVQTVDVVMNFAAESHNDNSLANPRPFWDTNIIGTYTLLEAVRKYRVFYHHVSTDEVFGDLPIDSTATFQEESRYQPSSPYSATKASSDHLVRAWVRSFGIQATISNSSNNYGPYQYVEKLIPRTIATVMSGEKPQIFGSGKQVRDWLHVTDHVRGLLAILERGQSGQTYLFSANCQLSNLTVVQKILHQLGQNSSNISHVADRPGHDQRYALDASSTMAALDWHPAFSDFDAGLEETIAWYQNHQNWWQKAHTIVEAKYLQEGRR